MSAGQLTLDLDGPTAARERHRAALQRRSLDPAAFAARERLSGRRLARENNDATGLDNPSDALASARCRCERWTIILNGDAPARCIKCGRAP